MILVASYCRVSTDKDDQANSFEAQRKYFKDYITRQPDWELYKVYADEGITGTSTKKRVQFNHMIHDARKGKFKLIITKEVSRFSRNILDTIAFTRELKALGVGVLFMTDGINTMDPDAELRLSIMGSIAQEESRKTSARVKWGQTRQMEKGVVFGKSLLGYDVKDGKLYLEPVGAEIVKLIFYKYGIEKKGTSIIARELREAGYLTFRGHSNWSNTHIIKILKNEKYVGDLCQKKTVTLDYLTHEKKINRGEEKLSILRTITNRSSAANFGILYRSKSNAATVMEILLLAIPIAICSPVRSSAVFAVQPLFPERRRGKAAAAISAGAVLMLQSMV